MLHISWQNKDEKIKSHAEIFCFTYQQDDDITLNKVAQGLSLG